MTRISYKYIHMIQRAVSLMLCAAVFLGSICFSDISIFAAVGTNSLNEWTVEVVWDNSDSRNYTLSSSSDETLRPKMRVSYYLPRAEQTYSVGEVRFTINGIDDIGRSGLVTAVTTVDQSSSKWTLRDDSPSGQYVFENKYAIEQGEALSGGFEIMWEFNSRDGINGYTKKITPKFSIKNTSGEFETAELPELSFGYTSVRDYYYVVLERTERILAEDYETVTGMKNGSGSSPYENYSWYRETVKFNPQTRARGVSLSNFFVAVEVTDAGGTKLSEANHKRIQAYTSNGKRHTLEKYELYSITNRDTDKNKYVYGYYEFTDMRGDISSSDYIFHLGYPTTNEQGNTDNTFDGKNMKVTVYLSSLYKDERVYVTLNNQNNNENLVSERSNTNENYRFVYTPGQIGHEKFNGQYEKYVYEQNHYEHYQPDNYSDRLLANTIYNDKIVEYNFNLSVRFDFSTSSGASVSSTVSEHGKTTSSSAGYDKEKGIYAVEGDDWVAIETESGKMRRLEKDEYDIAYITVPKDDKGIEYEVFAAEQQNLRMEAYASVGVGNTSSEKTFRFSKGKYCAFYIVFKGIKVKYEQRTKVGIRYHIKDNVTYIDSATGEQKTYPKPSMRGRIANFSYLRCFTDSDLKNENLFILVDASSYQLEYAQEIMEKDLEIYSDDSLPESDARHYGYIYRKYSNVYLREPVVRLTSSTVTNNGLSAKDYIKAISSDYGEGYAFTISSGGTVIGDDDMNGAELKKFSIHTLLPQELEPSEGLSAVRYGSGENDILKEVSVTGYALSTSGLLITADDFADHVTYSVRKTDEGQTIVTASFDFSDMPLDMTSMTNVRMTYPVTVDRATHKSGSKEYNIYSYTSIQDNNISRIEGTSIYNDNNDVDNDKDKLERVAQSKGTVEGEAGVYEWEDTVYKSVQTSVSNGYTSAKITPVQTFAKAKADSLPTDRTTYSYRLEADIGSSVRNVVMYDNIEPTNITYNNGEDSVTVTSDWQGTLLNVDTSNIMSMENVVCRVFYSTNRNETSTISNGTENDNWHLMEQSGNIWTVPVSEQEEAASVAVYVNTSSADSVITKAFFYAEINMQSPIYPGERSNPYIARNMYRLLYERKVEDSFSAEELDSEITNVELIENLPQVTFIKLDKDTVGENKRKLKGAEFELYIDSDNDGEYDEGTDQLIDSGVTNNYGKWTTYKMKYSQLYFLYEKKSPTGFYASDNPKEVIITEDPKKESCYEVEVDNERYKGTLKFSKTDADGGTSGNLPGAEFEIYESGGEQIFFVDNGDGTYTYNENASDVTGVLTTTVNGFTVTELPWGNYYVKETVPPDGFELNGSDFVRFSVTSSTTGFDTTGEPIFIKREKSDTEKTASLILKKFSETGETLQGAWYNLQKYDYDDKEWKDIASYLSTNSSGYIEVNDLKFGAYRFVEINAPTGYKMKGESAAENTAKSPIDEQLYIEGNNEIDVNNYVSRKTGVITLNADTVNTTIHVNDVNERLKGSATIVKKNLKDETPIERVKFDLYLLSDDRQSRTLIKSGLTTDADGKVSAETGDALDDGFFGVKELEWGVYQFVETYVPMGYKLDTEPVEFEINAENVSILSENVKYNERKNGSVVLKKMAGQNTAVDGTTIPKDSLLTGAKFSLYTNSGELIKVHRISEGRYEISETESENTVSEMETGSTGDVKGLIYVENLEWGVYYLEETQAPNGFRTAEKVRFSVNAYTCSSVQELECYDEPMECEIIINKEIDEVIDSFGTPTFIFRVRDTNNVNVGWTKIVTVDKSTKKGTVSFSVPTGTYDIEELEVSRYVLQSAVQTAGGKTQYATVTANADKTLTCTFSPVSGKKAVAEVTFTNKLTNYSKVGDNSNITNILPSARKITGLVLEYPEIVPVVKNGTGTYILRAEDLVGYLIYDDGEKSDTPLTKEQLESITYTPADNELQGLTVRNGINDANSEQMINASYSYQGRTLKTAFFVTIGSVQTKSVQKVIFNVDVNNASYFLKNGTRVTSNVVYYSDGERVNGTYIVPSRIDSSDSETLYWMDKAEGGATVASMDESSVTEYINSLEDAAEIVLYVRVGRPVYKFGGNTTGKTDTPGEYDNPDETDPTADPDPEKPTTEEPTPKPEYEPETEETNSEVWTVSSNGYYYIKVWGASGGDLNSGEDYAQRSSPNRAGHGGYSEVLAYLKAGTKLYIFRGGKGLNDPKNGGAAGGVYGGGDGGNAQTGSGGGMTYVSLSNNPVKSDSDWDTTGTLVAAGGGGGAGVAGDGGDAKATASSGYAQGKGASSSEASCGGSGGGYWGGQTVSGGTGGNGGSGYTASGTVYADYQQADIILSKSMSGSEIIPTYRGAVLDRATQTMIGHIGSGYVEIVGYGDTVPIEYTGKTGSFTAPKSGYYKLEAWGAAGGSARKAVNDAYPISFGSTEEFMNETEEMEGGRGGYSSGMVYLIKGQVIYYAVGGMGDTYFKNGSSGEDNESSGGFNGGYSGGSEENNSYVIRGSGGGATHFALTDSGKLSSYSSSQQQVLLVAGGGGGSSLFQNPTNTSEWWYGHGGAGGGIEGQPNYAQGVGNDVYTATGGTQTGGGESSRSDYSSYTGQFGKGIWTGAGGGWYGGAATGAMGASGGSGYIGNPLLVNGITVAGNTEPYTLSDGTTAQPTYIPAYDGAIGVESNGMMIGNRGNGFAQITYIGIPKEMDYNSTGNIQTFTAPLSGYYKLEAWGAEGGRSRSSSSGYPNTDEETYTEVDGGHGGYSYGTVYLNAGQTIYIGVGSMGKTLRRNSDGSIEEIDWSDGTSKTSSLNTSGQYLSGGFNGGGMAGYIDNNGFWDNGTGGGATHFALTDNGVLSSYSSSQQQVLLVAGGGGGSSFYQNSGNSLNWYCGTGGAGGGTEGQNNANNNSGSSGAVTVTGGTQNSGGTGSSSGAFGTGGSSAVYNTGGGGGWYGGASSEIQGGAGGSGHLNNEELSSDYEMGTVSGTELFLSPSGEYETGHTGNGYAKVTYIGSDSVQNFDYIGDYQMFVAPKTGTYKLEAWGAQGGSVAGVAKAVGGKGAYTSGEIELEEGDTLYVCVGGEGTSVSANKTSKTDLEGGWNGGGNVEVGKGSASGGDYFYKRAFGTGGGATDFRLVKGGTWRTFVSMKTRIMVAAGGGGSYKDSNPEKSLSGGAGGALEGIPGNMNNRNWGDVTYSGGKQTQGGYTIIVLNGVEETDESKRYAGTGQLGKAVPTRCSTGAGHTGAGSGYYAGGCSYHTQSSGGGSSFVSGYPGCDAISDETYAQDHIFHTGQPNHYSGYVFENPEMVAGTDIMPRHDGTAGLMEGNTGNGYARVTFIG